MLALKEFITQNLTLFPIFGACAVFTWGVIQFLINRSRENDESQFKRFHDILRKIQHDVDDGKHTSPYIEIQIAAIYELRFLKRYFPVSKIYLAKKRAEWVAYGGQYQTYGVPVIDSTLVFIERGTVMIRMKNSFLSYYRENPFI